MATWSKYGGAPPVFCRRHRPSPRPGPRPPAQRTALLVQPAELLKPLGGEAPDQELQVPGIDGQADLPLCGQADHVTGILLGPALTQGVVLGVPGKLSIFII